MNRIPLSLLAAIFVFGLAGHSPARAANPRPGLSVSGSPAISTCPLFPQDNIWNASVNELRIDPHSKDWIHSIGSSTGLHMDFGSGTWDGGPIGIPYNLGDSATPTYAVSFLYSDESDTGPYPIPASPTIEYGSDHHLLMVDQSTCHLYEMWDTRHNADGSWSAGSGAIWDLNSDALRPAGWTSADAAGLPILPGLVRYEEVAAGHIDHALRFTANSTNSYIWPARHLTSGTPGRLTSTPPMGARFRLKASFDISSYPPQLQVILQAMKTYGLILADNGSDWYISGAPDEHWDNTMLHLLDNVTGSDFEAVDTSGLMIGADSGAAKPGVTAIPSLLAPAEDEILPNRRPDFDWNDVSGATGYIIQISINDSFTTLAKSATTTLSAYTPTADLPADATLWWRVGARFGSTFGGWSSGRSFTTANPPSVPVLGAPGSNALIKTYTPTLYWKPSVMPLVGAATFDHYQVQVSVDPTFDAGDIGGVTTGSISVASFMPSSALDSSTKYYWRVRAYNSDGEYSAWSAVRYFRTLIAKPILDSPTGGASIGMPQTFTWHDDDPATKYKIQISVYPDFHSVLKQASVVGTSFTTTTIFPTGTLYWRVQALLPNGPSAWSDYETCTAP